MKASIKRQVLRTILASALIASALGSCGKAAEQGEELQIDSNTNWLKRCDADDQCSGSLRCYCGQCSRPCAESDECNLLAGAECASSGGAVCSAQPSAGGLCVLGCQSDADCGANFSCDGNQCVPRPCDNGYLSWDDLYDIVAVDAAQLDSADAAYTRYVSLANHFAYGACVSTLEAERQGMRKLLNSLSLAPTIGVPVPVDEDLTTYRIDLRDYAWDHPIDVGGRSYADVWEAIVANNPFATRFAGGSADDAVADTGTGVPVMFINSLIATASRADIYYAILDIPSILDELLADLAVDANTYGVRAGYRANPEMVAIANPEILASRWPLETRSGFLWQLTALDGLLDSVFADPLQLPEGERQLIFSLPNGLSAFAYMDVQGRRLDDSDTFLDLTQNNFRAQAPRTLFREHWPQTAVRDDVRAYVETNRDQFDIVTLEEVAMFYPGADAIEALLQQEYEEFTRPALDSALVDARSPEPISATFAEYDRDVTLEDAAGELMMTAEDVEDNLYLLSPALGVLDGGGVDRDDFALVFRETLCVLAVTLEVQPAFGICP
jgi:hypothetical protein